MMKHYKILISGLVQGVYFRASTKEKAEELGLKGIVRNMPDGNVYLEAEGEEDRIDLLIDWCKRGPERARVEEVVAEEGPLKKFTSFEVSR
jgi:acylphosphatase